MPMTASPARHGANQDARLREEREGEPHQAVGPHLQHHAREDHRAGRGRLDVRVREPGVEREQRHLDRERQREREEEPELLVKGLRHVVELQQIEAVDAGRRLVQVGEAEDGQQHQDAGGHRIQDELDGGVDAPLVAPDADQEVHRHQHRVPEDVEEEQIERDEDADHRALEQQQEDAERPGLLAHRLPRAEQRERRQEAGEDDEQQADAVDADGILDAERRDPGVALDELEVAGAGVEAAPQAAASRRRRAATRSARSCARTARSAPRRRGRRAAAIAPAIGSATSEVRIGNGITVSSRKTTIERRGR